MSVGVPLKNTEGSKPYNLNRSEAEKLERLCKLLLVLTLTDQTVGGLVAR